MKKFFIFAFLFALSAETAFLAQTQPANPGRQQTANQQGGFDMTEYGVQIQPDARLIVVMAALEAAGFDSKATEISPFRKQLRDDLKDLDPDLRRRLRDFFERGNKILETNRLEEMKRTSPSLSASEAAERAKVSPSEQVARYVSLAYALTPAPELGSPERTTDLPGSLLEVLDFAPLVREFYRKSGVAERLPEYTRKHQAFGDSLRPQTAKMVRDVTSYLNTRPQTAYLERVTVKAQPANEKKQKTTQNVISTRERSRRFIVVPDLLAVPNTVRLRAIGDDYFAVISPEVVPSESSELRRAYLQYLFDALTFKNAKEITAQREAIKQLIDERAKTGASVSPDPYLAVARSLVVAADVSQRKQERINEITREAQNEDAKKRLLSADEIRVVNNRLTFPKAEATAFAELAEAYESGAVLAFYFADQLRGQETSGFDIASSLPEMISAFDAAKERAKIKETERARAQALTELRNRRENAVKSAAEDETAARIRNDALVKNLNEVEQMLITKDYEQAEARLLELLRTYQGEPRIFYSLGRTASLSAQGAFDSDLQEQRLKKAFTHYSNAIQASNDSTSPILLVQTYVALGKILEFYERNDEALKAFEAAVKIGDSRNVKDNAYAEAVAARQRLAKK